MGNDNQFIAGSSGTSARKFCVCVCVCFCVYIHIYIYRPYVELPWLCLQCRVGNTHGGRNETAPNCVLRQKWKHRGDCKSDHAGSISLAAWFIEAFESTPLSTFAGCSHTTTPLPRYMQHSSLMQETHLLRELYLLRRWHNSLYITSSKNTPTFLATYMQVILYRIQSDFHICDCSLPNFLLSDF